MTRRREVFELESLRERVKSFIVSSSATKQRPGRHRRATPGTLDDDDNREIRTEQESRGLSLPLSLSLSLSFSPHSPLSLSPSFSPPDSNDAANCPGCLVVWNLVGLIVFSRRLISASTSELHSQQSTTDVKTLVSSVFYTSWNFLWYLTSTLTSEELSVGDLP